MNTLKHVRMDELEDVKNRKLQALRNVDNDVYEAVVWLRQNRHLFKNHVFDPICLEINVKNKKFADAIESNIRNFLRVTILTFTIQKKGTLRIFDMSFLLVPFF